jgi:undecaprenyl diphosphate synthase
MELYGYHIDKNRLPGHIAIIMDGNGRWAKRKGLDRVKGHEKGYLVLKKIIEFNKNLGVPYISVFAFSTENWNRPKNEVDFLMHLAKHVIGEYTSTLMKNDIRIIITGSRDNLDGELNRMLDESMEKTRNCKSYILNIVFNYGSRKEIAEAARKIAEDYKNGRIDIKSINENSFGNYLYQPSLPVVDLLIRTSGELRISNFLIWQAAYAEFWFTRKYWPDFGPRDFCRAVSDYQKRKRRFGGI